MYDFLRTTALAVALTSCTASSSTVIESSDRRAVDGWQKGEVLVTDVSPTFGKYSYREGKTQSGLFYRYYTDGSGTVSRSPGALNPDWNIQCRRDKMNDQKDCEIVSRRTPLFLDYGFSDAPTQVCVQGHDFPQRTAMIRVDSSSPHTTDKRGCLPAKQIISQLQGGKRLATRKVHWPYERHVDEEGDLVGLPEAMELLQIIRGKLQAT